MRIALKTKNILRIMLMFIFDKVKSFSFFLLAVCRCEGWLIIKNKNRRILGVGQ